MKQTAVEWLEKILEGQKDKPFDYDEWSIALQHAKEIEKEQMIEFACKVVEVSAEKYIQGKTTEQIAKELLTFKSE